MNEKHGKIMGFRASKEVEKLIPIAKDQMAKKLGVSYVTTGSLISILVKEFLEKKNAI